MARNWGGHNPAAQVRLAPGLLWGQHLSWAWSGQATVGEGAVGGVPGDLGPSHPPDQAGGPVTLGEMKQEEPQGKGPEGVAERTRGPGLTRPSLPLLGCQPLPSSTSAPPRTRLPLCSRPQPSAGRGGGTLAPYPSNNLSESWGGAWVNQAWGGGGQGGAKGGWALPPTAARGSLP